MGGEGEEGKGGEGRGERGGGRVHIVYILWHFRTYGTCPEVTLTHQHPHTLHTLC